MAPFMQEFCMVRQPPSASQAAMLACRLSGMPVTPHKRFVGNNLRLAIEAVETSQAAFARRMGLSSTTKLGNWLRGDNYPDPAFLARVCEEYGLTMDWFYRAQKAGVASGVAAHLPSVAPASEGGSRAAPPLAGGKRD
jgi:DNA-binding transcriptional regulator YiaG